ncbi:MAG: diguanylate cyclase [Pseudomonadota bacterium]
MLDKAKFEELKANGRLPSPKGVAFHVLVLIQKEDITNQEIAHAIKSDPALSGRIIKATNALGGYQVRPVVSIVDAVMVLGLNTVRQLVLGLSLINSSPPDDSHKFDMHGFWLHSLLAAIAAHNLLLHSDLGAPEEMFILGLLGQVGSLGLATSYPQEYARLLEQAGADESSALEELELAEFGFHHNQLTQALLADWGMPRIFQDIVLYQENPAQANFAEGSREWRLLHALHIANYLATLCLAPTNRQANMVAQLILLATRLGVEVGMLVELGDKSVREWAEWGELFGMGTVEVPPFAELLKAGPLTSNTVDAGVLLPTPEADYKLRILLVDDDWAALFLLRTMLEQAGHTVVTAANGVEALRQVEISMPQLIITDWAMPEMDGIEFCQALRRNPAWCNIHVFILTAQESTDRLVEAFEAGVDDYLTKPINSRVLAARLRAGQRVVQLQEELEYDRQQLRNFAVELAASNERLQLLALTDVLTGLHNRRYANEYLERLWALAERSGRPLSCMLLDIDGFKQINDTYGHKMGDDALKQVATVLRASARTEDEVCRFGGEEFLLICPDTPAEQAYQYAERLRQNVAASRIRGADGKEFHLTVSIGIASKKVGLLNTEMLLQLADKRLYAAKNNGRNCTVAA